METWLSWGMMLSEYTMALKGWVKGSIAAASAQLHACLGRVLARINGNVVSTIHDVGEALADATSIALVFRPFLASDAAKVSQPIVFPAGE